MAVSGTLPVTAYQSMVFTSVPVTPSCAVMAKEVVARRGGCPGAGCRGGIGLQLAPRRGCGRIIHPELVGHIRPTVAEAVSVTCVLGNCGAAGVAATETAVSGVAPVTRYQSEVLIPCR